MVWMVEVTFRRFLYIAGHMHVYIRLDWITLRYACLLAVLCQRNLYFAERLYLRDWLGRRHLRYSNLPFTLRK